MKETTIAFDDELEARLRNLAAKKGSTVDSVIDEAVRAYLRSIEWKDLQGIVSKQASGMGLHSEDDVDRMIHDLRAETQ